ncbi:MAG TPA: DUF4321 domain-containing protein [Clostridiales bacterium]|jgi:hypothetical protein|nr:DUF4321 domain-containing protein [Clostridiales bacterium]
MARSVGKNKWALFLLILVGIVLGSFIGHLVRGVDFLSWLNSGLDFAVGNPDGSGVVSLDLGAVAVHIGIRIKITIASVLGALAAVLIYKKI